jgi:hypothetical protein
MGKGIMLGSIVGGSSYFVFKKILPFVPREHKSKHMAFGIGLLGFAFGGIKGGEIATRWHLEELQRLSSSRPK